MRFVIGDIHGEIVKLKSLINHIFNIDKNPQLIFIGDYLDKGNNPKAVLDYIVNLKFNNDCVFLMGNHEYIWMNLAPGDIYSNMYLTKYGGISTLKSLGKSDFNEGRKMLMTQYNDFFSSLKSFWKTDSFIVVHSGINPKNYSNDIKDIPTKELLFNRYNFMGHEELFMKKYRVIFGHTGFFTPFVSNYKIGIDTGACYLPQQPITSFCIDKLLFINSEGKIKYLKDFDKNYCPNIVRTSPRLYVR